jgi:hypothetical protein
VAGAGRFVALCNAERTDVLFETDFQCRFVQQLGASLPHEL